MNTPIPTTVNDDEYTYLIGKPHPLYPHLTVLRGNYLANDEGVLFYIGDLAPGYGPPPCPAAYSFPKAERLAHVTELRARAKEKRESEEQRFLLLAGVQGSKDSTPEPTQKSALPQTPAPAFKEVRPEHALEKAEKWHIINMYVCVFAWMAATILDGAVNPHRPGESMITFMIDAAFLAAFIVFTVLFVRNQCRQRLLPQRYQRIRECSAILGTLRASAHIGDY